MTKKTPLDSRLRAAAFQLGLERAVELLKNQLVTDLVDLSMKVAIEGLVRARLPAGDAAPKVLPSKSVPKKAPAKQLIQPKALALPAPASGKVDITQDGEHFVAQLPGGRQIRSRRRRDVARRIRAEGFTPST
jgi:hypothetical protein